MVEDVLSETSLRRRDLYDPGAVRQPIERNRRGSDDNSLVMWTMLTTELWFHTHFDSV